MLLKVLLLVSLQTQATPPVWEKTSYEGVLQLDADVNLAAVSGIDLGGSRLKVARIDYDLASKSYTLRTEKLCYAGKHLECLELLKSLAKSLKNFKQVGAAVKQTDDEES